MRLVRREVKEGIYMYRYKSVCDHLMTILLQYKHASPTAMHNALYLTI